MSNGRMCHWSDVWMLVDTESSVTGTRVQHGMLLRFHSPEPHELHVPFSRYLPPSNVNDAQS